MFGMTSIPNEAMPNRDYPIYKLPEPFLTTEQDGANAAGDT